MNSRIKQVLAAVAVSPLLAAAALAQNAQPVNPAAPSKTVSSTVHPQEAALLARIKKEDAAIRADQKLSPAQKTALLADLAAVKKTMKTDVKKAGDLLTFLEIKHRHLSAGQDQSLNKQIGAVKKQMNAPQAGAPVAPNAAPSAPGQVPAPQAGH